MASNGLDCSHAEPEDRPPRQISSTPGSRERGLEAGCRRPDHLGGRARCGFRPSTVSSTVRRGIGE